MANQFRTTGKCAVKVAGELYSPTDTRTFALDDADAARFVAAGAVQAAEAPKRQRRAKDDNAPTQDADADAPAQDDPGADADA